MKKLIPILLLVFGFTANATTYYISSSGNDANNGTSTSTPWKTLTKLNSFFSSLKPGDNVLLNRGNVFYGSITVNKGGTSGSPITIGAYGTGAQPVVTGFTTISSWTNLGSNIWESTNTVTSLSTFNMVVINGVNTGMGRYPNTGFLAYQSHSGTSSITSSSLTGSPNWTGAEVVIRVIRWTLERDKITSQSGGKLTYSGSTATPTDGYGFFIQNDPRTLDVQNEWYYNPSTKKLRIYSTSTPANVQVTTIDRLAYTNGFSYLTFDNIDFEGANTTLLQNKSSQHLVVQNCTFNFSGRYGMYIDNGSSVNESMTIDHNVFNNITENTMSFLGYATNAWIKNNTISNTGMIGGAQSNNQSSCDAIDINGKGSIIEYNSIINTGHTAIAMRTSDAMVARYNYISYFGMTKYDAGGIYSWNADSVTAKTRTIDHNFIIYSKQTSDGIGTASLPSLFGVYLDGSSKNTVITNNTVAHCKNGDGIHILNSGTCTINNNTSYDNGNQLAFLHAFNGGMIINKMIVKHNIFFSRALGQMTFFYRDDDNLHFNTFGVADSNYYTRPIDDNLTTQSVVVYDGTNRTLPNWQSFTKQDIHSKKAPKTVSDTNDIRFEFNATSSSKTVPLPYNYIDVYNVSYNGSITLAPYTSAILIKNGATSNLLPAVNPANTVNGLNYKYYEAANFSVIPAFSSLSPVKTGTTTNFNISLANKSDQFAFSFTGYVTVPSDGQYTFYTNSDDGSNLYIDNVPVVNNDGVHPAQESAGTIGLKAGKHAISVAFFEQVGGSILTVSYAGPSVLKQVIPASALYRVSGSGLVALDNNTDLISTKASIKAYPNPFTSYIEVNITGDAGEYKLVLVDVSGKILWTKNGLKNSGAFQESINTSALQRGVYFLKVIQNNNSSVVKLLK